MEEDFRALLLGSTSVTQIAGDRINFGEHPQGEGFPAIVLTTVSASRGQHMNGPNIVQTGRVQVDCYATTYSGSKVLSRAVFDLLHSYSGGRFQLITHLSSRDSRESGAIDAERLYRVGLDFTTAWRP